MGPGAPLFDHALAGVASAASMRTGNPLWAALIDVILGGAMVLFLLRAPGRRPRDGALTGAVLALVASGMWNLANAVVLRGWPAALTVADMGGHVALGAAAGALLALVAARVERRAPATA